MTISSLRFLFLLVIVPVSAFAATKFDLGVLSETAATRTTPEELRKFLAGELKEELRECLAAPKWGLKRAEDFFASVPVSLGKPKDATFLVFPAQFCPGGLFGASASPFWIVRKDANGRFAVLLWSTTWYVKIYDTRTNGYRDIGLRYGDQPDTNDEIYQFNGQEYLLRR